MAYKQKYKLSDLAQEVIDRLLPSGGSLPTPNAPTAMVVDDAANTFNWTETPSYNGYLNYEYSTNAGTIWTVCTNKPQSVGNVNIPIGQLKLRVKAVAGIRNAGLPLTSTVAFTIASVAGLLEGAFTLVENTLNIAGTFANPFEDVQVVRTINCPDGSTKTIRGFHDGGSVWKIRYAPNQTGSHTTSTVITKNGVPEAAIPGSFNVGAAISSGFIKISPIDSRVLIHADGTPFNPIGVGQNTFTENITGGVQGWGIEEFTYVGIDEYFSRFGNGHADGALINLLRISVDNNHPFPITVTVGGNTYSIEDAQGVDALIAKGKQYGMKTWLVIFSCYPDSNCFDFTAGAIQAANQRVINYFIDRYSALVDFAEICNESQQGAIPEKIAAITGMKDAAVLRDPYNHPITTSWSPGGGYYENLDWMEISTRHIYWSPADVRNTDLETVAYFDTTDSYAKPSIWGEKGRGDYNWSATSYIELRMQAYTAFMRKGAFIPWALTAVRAQPPTPAQSASNQYMGAAERAGIRGFRLFSGSIKTEGCTRSAANIVTGSGTVRGYTLANGIDSYAAYLVNGVSHSASTTGIEISITTGFAGTATWYNTVTNQILGTQAVGAGTQTLQVPAFTIDIAMKVI